jgi:hypothetical protein
LLLSRVLVHIHIHIHIHIHVQHHWRIVVTAALRLGAGYRRQIGKVAGFVAHHFGFCRRRVQFHLEGGRAYFDEICAQIVRAENPQTEPAVVASF